MSASRSVGKTTEEKSTSGSQTEEKSSSGSEREITEESSSEECPLRVVPGKSSSFLQNHPGHGWMEMPCAPSTHFSLTMCTCVTRDSQWQGEEEDRSSQTEGKSSSGPENETTEETSSEGSAIGFTSSTSSINPLITSTLTP